MEKKPPCDDTHIAQHTEGHAYCKRHTQMCKLLTPPPHTPLLTPHYSHPTPRTPHLPP